MTEEEAVQAANRLIVGQLGCVCRGYAEDESAISRVKYVPPATPAGGTLLVDLYIETGGASSRDGSNPAASFACSCSADAGMAETVNGLNQVVTSGSTPVDHSARGTVIEIGDTGYNYNAQNQMSSTSTGATFGYDSLDRLISVTTASGARRFVHDGHSIIAEYDGAGANSHRYIRGAGVDEALAWDDRTDPAGVERFYAHADERGSVIGYSDYADRMVRLNRYDEYGNPQSGVVNGGFGFTGQPWLPEIGMYYYRARIYNPNLARFMQPDPIGYGSGMNLYAYVRNDPVNLADPSGLDPNNITVTAMAMIRRIQMDFQRSSISNDLFASLASSNSEPDGQQLYVTGTRTRQRRPIQVSAPPSSGRPCVSPGSAQGSYFLGEEAAMLAGAAAAEADLRNGNDNNERYWSTLPVSGWHDPSLPTVGFGLFSLSPIRSLAGCNLDGVAGALVPAAATGFGHSHRPNCGAGLSVGDIAAARALAESRGDDFLFALTDEDGTIRAWRGNDRLNGPGDVIGRLCR